MAKLRMLAKGAGGSLQHHVLFHVSPHVKFIVLAAEVINSIEEKSIEPEKVVSGRAHSSALCAFRNCNTFGCLPIQILMDGSITVNLYFYRKHNFPLATRPRMQFMSLSVIVYPKSSGAKCLAQTQLERSMGKMYFA